MVKMVDITGAGRAMLGVSPTNLSGLGKIGSLTATGIIEIGPGYSMDYTRIPARLTKSGVTVANTIGRV